MTKKRRCGICLLLISVVFYIAVLSGASMTKVNADISKDDLMNTVFTRTVNQISDSTTAIYERYIQNGVFPSCNVTDTFQQCKAAQDAKTEADAYSQYVQSSLRQYDSSSTRLNEAMDTFNEYAHTVYSFLTGFGCLSSLIVFMLIFVRITWLPDNTAQRRKAMEDVVVSGAATILLGGIWLVVSVFQASFSRIWESKLIYTKDWNVAANVFLYEYKNFIVGLSGIATLTTLLMMLKSIVGIITSGSNPSVRAGKMKQALICGIATAGLGSLTIFTGMFWNALA